MNKDNFDMKRMAIEGCGVTLGRSRGEKKRRDERRNQ